MIRRGKLFGAGLGLAGAGGASLVSAFWHQATGEMATATLFERGERCFVEAVGFRAADPPQSEVDCRDAADVRIRVGDKFQVRRVNLERLRYVGRDGVAREATVDMVAPWKSPPGTQFTVIYDPAKPQDVRAPLAWPFLGGLSAVFALGLLLLALGF